MKPLLATLYNYSGTRETVVVMAFHGNDEATIVRKDRSFSVVPTHLLALYKMNGDFPVARDFEFDWTRVEVEA